MRRLAAFLSTALACAALSAPAAAAPIPAGGLNGVGCVSNPTDAPLFGCTVGHSSLGRLHDVKLSPDGKQLYAVGGNSGDGAPGRLLTFGRDVTTGALTFAACRGDGLSGCTNDTRLKFPGAFDLAPGGADLYVADYGFGVVHYRRGVNGALTYDSCRTPTVVAGCSVTAGLEGPSGVAVSPDGSHVYVTSYLSDAIALFSRNATTGKLAFVQCWTTGGAAGCTALGGTSLTSASAVVVTADGGHVYASGRGGNAVTGLTRDPSTGKLSSPQALVSNNYLDGPQTLAVAPEGNALYAGLFDGSGLTTLSLAPTTGTPTLLACWRHPAVLPTCPTSLGVNSVFGLDLSPDGSILYAAARDGGTIASFRRGANGALSFVSCANTPEQPESGCGRSVNGLAGIEAVAASSDGRFVYGAGWAGIATLRPEQAPLCSPLARTVANGRPTDFQVSCSDADGQPVSVAVASQPAHGTVTVLDAATGHLRYQPQPGFDGTDVVGFVASDGTNPSPTANATLTVPRDVVAPRMRIPTKRVRLSSRGKARIKVRCLPGEPGGCVGKLAIRSPKGKRPSKLGSRRFSIPEGKTKTVTITVPKRGRSLVHTAGRLRVLLVATAKDPTGNRGAARKRIALVAP